APRALAATLLVAAAASLTPACSRSSSSGGPAPAPSQAAMRCGTLECAQFASPTEAFLQTLLAPGGADDPARGPLVVAVGEAHAPKGATAPSAARRFTSDILPLLAGR